MRMSDSLVLSRDQMQKIQLRRVSLTSRADTLYTALGIYLAALPMKYKDDDAEGKINETRDAMWKAIYAETPFLNELLSRGQVARLPLGMRQMLTVKDYKGRFFFNNQ
jgi:hypothetical protein